MFCPRCGKEIQNNQRFCTNCGYDCSKDTNENEEKDEFSYKHKSYYKKPIKKDFDVSKFTFNTGIELMFKGFLIMALLLAGLLGVNFVKRYISSDLFGLDRAKYESYMQDPTSIPELTQPENLDGLIKNLKDTQDFLALYLKYSDDSSDVKADVFDNYRKQLLKIEGFSNDNLLKDEFKYSLPQTAKEFKKCERHYNGELKSVGLKIVADTTYSKYHLCEDNRFTDKKFGKLVEPTMSKYLKLRAKHHKEFLSTGYLAVKPKEMNSRIADYENFLNANPEFKNIKEVQDWLYCYTIGYIFASDREDMNAIRHSKFKKLDKSFIRKYKNSKLIPIFSKMVSSANGISTSQFDSLYPYEYEKMLNSIRPSDGNLEDIFATQRKELMKKLSNVGYRYVYSTQSDSWETFNDISKIGKDCLLLADNGHGGFDIYDNKFKKTNQTLIFDQNAKVMIKRGNLLVYTPVSLQVSRVEYFYGSFNTKVLSSRAIREYFPDVLIINVDNIGNEPVQITKDKTVQSYMLISHAGSNFDGYQLNADGPMTRGELSNIFTINSPTTVNVEWLPTNTAGQCYSMSFVSNIPQSEEPQQDTSQPEAVQTNGTSTKTITKPLVKPPVKATVKPPVQEEEDNEHF